ncbi:MAG: YceI family protein [Balneolaceae bacterium]|nr:YceI family protein [Balneolaceae bacterium]
MKKITVVIIVIFCCIGNLFSQSFKTDTGYVEFKSSVPLHSFTGTSNHLVGKISLPDSTVDFYIDLNTLDTGIGKRDRDMRQTLEVEEYPFAEFYGKLSSRFNYSEQDTQSVTATGKFTLHGISKQIEVNGKLYPNEKGLYLEASWILNLSDYNIKPPGILFYRVDEEQEIKIEALLNPLKE